MREILRKFSNYFSLNASRRISMPAHHTKDGSFGDGPSSSIFSGIQLLRKPIWSSINYNNLSTDGFQKNIIVYRCINLIAKGAASVPWTLSKRGNEILDHKLLDLVNRPNKFQGGAKFWESVISYLMIAGNAYIEISYDDNEDRYNLNLLRPDRVTIVARDGFRTPLGYNYSEGKNKKKFYPIDQQTGASNILHIKGFHPLDDWYGMSPIEAAAKSIDQHNAVAGHNLAILQNGGRPSGILIAGKNCPESKKHNLAKSIERIRDDLYNAYQGADNAGKMMVLEGDLEWKETGFSPKDLDFIDGKKMSAREIAQAFGVPPTLVGVPGDATFANYKEARFHLWEDTIIPLLDSITDELNHWLAPRFGNDLVLGHNIDSIPALAPHREKQWQKIESASFLTTNEKRQMLGFPPLSSTKDHSRGDSSKIK